MYNGVRCIEINSLSNSTYVVINNKLTFSDTAGHWAKTQILNMGSRTAVQGVGESAFEPERNITRAEFAAMIVKGLGIKLDDYSGKFTDVGASSWCAKYVETAYNYGLVLGYEDGTFKPNDIITREQIFAMICRAMKITELSSGLASSEINSVYSNYTDEDKVASFFKTEVAACIKTGVVNGRTSTQIAPKANITRA